MLQLSEEELSQTYQRASQILEQQADTASPSIAKEGYEAYLAAAEEAGIPRQAMLQALRERFLVPIDSIKPGDIVFAPSADKGWYAASVLRVESETSLIVQFLTGGEQSVSVTDIRPLGLVPGREVEFDYQVVVPEMHGIWQKGKITAFDAATQQAKIIHAATVYSVPLTQLRVQAQKQQTPLRIRQLLIRAILIAGSVTGIIGFLLGHFLR